MPKWTSFYKFWSKSCTTPVKKKNFEEKKPPKCPRFLEFQTPPSPPKNADIVRVFCFDATPISGHIYLRFNVGGEKKMSFLFSPPLPHPVSLIQKKIKQVHCPREGLWYFRLICFLVVENIIFVVLLPTDFCGVTLFFFLCEVTKHRGA